MSQTNQQHDKNADIPAGEDAAQPAENETAAEAADSAPIDPPEGASPIDPEDNGITFPEHEARIAELESEVNDAKEKMLRAMAEVENIRRRSQRERDDTSRYAVSGFARDMLSVADNLRRAVDSVDGEARKTNELIENLMAGVEATERELLNALQKHGIHKIEPLDVPFDPNLHEAMFEVDAPDKPTGLVVQLLEPGYVIHDRVLRPARVGVSKGGQTKAQSVDQEV